MGAAEFKLWAYQLLGWMKFVKRKATKVKSKHFEAVKDAFLDDVVAVVSMENIPPKQIVS